ncbi:MAG: hypothetical protein AB9915_02480 [Candidatus Dojkabacteria bacterium]
MKNSNWIWFVIIGGLILVPIRLVIFIMSPQYAIFQASCNYLEGIPAELLDEVDQGLFITSPVPLNVIPEGCIAFKATSEGKTIYVVSCPKETPHIMRWDYHIFSSDPLIIILGLELSNGEREVLIYSEEKFSIAMKEYIPASFNNGNYFLFVPGASPDFIIVSGLRSGEINPFDLLDNQIKSDAKQKYESHKQQKGK